MPKKLTPGQQIATDLKPFLEKHQLKAVVVEPGNGTSQIIDPGDDEPEDDEYNEDEYSPLRAPRRQKKPKPKKELKQHEV